MHNTITLILGGARSGKSTFAEQLASFREDVTYIATADAGDAEMEERIQIHKTRRPSAWKTWEGPIETLPQAMAEMPGTLLLDCLTMYLTRMLLASPAAESDSEAAWFEAERTILHSVETMLSDFRRTHADDASQLLVVSNEVGFGLVPPYLMGRRFRDMQGRANQIAAGCADRVAFVVAGLPLWIKGE